MEIRKAQVQSLSCEMMQGIESKIYSTGLKFKVQSVYANLVPAFCHPQFSPIGGVRGGFSKNKFAYETCLQKMKNGERESVQSIVTVTFDPLCISPLGGKLLPSADGEIERGQNVEPDYSSHTNNLIAPALIGLQRMARRENRARMRLEVLNGLARKSTGLFSRSATTTIQEAQFTFRQLTESRRGLFLIVLRNYQTQTERINTNKNRIDKQTKPNRQSRLLFSSVSPSADGGIPGGKGVTNKTKMFCDLNADILLKQTHSNLAPARQEHKFLPPKRGSVPDPSADGRQGEGVVSPFSPHLANRTVLT